MSTRLTSFRPISRETGAADEGIANPTVRQTLAEQMGITSYEVSNRKRPLGLTEAYVLGNSQIVATIG